MSLDSHSFPSSLYLFVPPHESPFSFKGLEQCKNKTPVDKDSLLPPLVAVPSSITRVAFSGRFWISPNIVFLRESFSE